MTRRDRLSNGLALTADTVIAATAIPVDHRIAIGRRADPRTSRRRRTATVTRRRPSPPSMTGPACVTCRERPAVVELLAGILTTSKPVGRYCHRCLRPAVEEEHG